MNKKNKDAITLGLDQKEIPKNWNFSFMIMQPHALHILQSKIQATILLNQVASNHLSTARNIDSGATSHICAHYSILEEYTKIKQTANV